MDENTEKINRWLTFLIFDSNNWQSTLWQWIGLWLGGFAIISGGIIASMSFFNINKFYALIIIVCICVSYALAFGFFYQLYKCLRQYKDKLNFLIGCIVIGHYPFLAKDSPNPEGYILNSDDIKKGYEIINKELKKNINRYLAKIGKHLDEDPDFKIRSHEPDSPKRLVHS